MVKNEDDTKKNTITLHYKNIGAKTTKSRMIVLPSQNSVRFESLLHGLDALEEMKVALQVAAVHEQIDDPVSYGQECVQ